MNSFTVGQGVIVSDRRDLYAYMEGVVFRAGPDRLGRVGVDFPKPDQDGMHDGRHMLDAATLSPLPKVGERRRWNARNSERRQLMGPFVITGRHDDTEERLFSIWYEARQVHGSASAAELAGFSELIEEHSDTEDGMTSDAHAVQIPTSGWKEVGHTTAEGVQLAPPRPGRDDLDTRRDAVLEAALWWDEAPDGFRLYDLRQTIRAYRAARDS